jgi:hypothetical protein
LDIVVFVVSEKRKENKLRKINGKKNNKNIKQRQKKIET